MTGQPGPRSADPGSRPGLGLREDAIIGDLDGWLAREFAPHRLTETIRDLAGTEALARRGRSRHRCTTRPRRWDAGRCTRHRSGPAKRTLSRSAPSRFRPRRLRRTPTTRPTQQYCGSDRRLPAHGSSRKRPHCCRCDAQHGKSDDSKYAAGKLWERKRVVRHYLHRWLLQLAMKRLREKVLAGTVGYPKAA